MDGGLTNGASTRALNALADSLGMNLQVGKRGELSAEDAFKLSAEPLGLKARLTVKVVSSFVSGNGEDVAALLQIAGHLYMFVFASDFDSQVKVLVVDGAKVHGPKEGIFEELSVRSWRGALKVLTAGVKAVYRRDFNEGHWTAGTL